MRAAASSFPPNRVARLSEDPQPRAAPYTVLAQRADFLAANKARRVPLPGFVLLVRPRGDGDDAMRLGITVTKKIGNAVVRNRMKRRFRALARELLPAGGVPGADHVLIGRDDGVQRSFDLLRAELAKALDRARADPHRIDARPPRKPRR